MTTATPDGPRFIGPPDPELFRVKVGNWGERFYIDPLPFCDIWPDDTAAIAPGPWPSVSTVKKAWPKGEGIERWNAGQQAEWAVDNVEHWRHFDRDVAIKLLSDSAGHSLNKAAGRGTGVHQMIDDLAHGRTPIYVDDEIQAYAESCKLVLADLKPSFLVTETVVISKRLGFGGTFDAGVSAVKIDGLGVCLVDWKSRKAGKNGAFPEEAAQLGGYASADYMIVAGADGNAVRAPMLEFDHGLIVSIDPDGYQVHVVHIDEAVAKWVGLIDFWRVKGGQPFRIMRVGRVDRPSAETAAPADDDAFTRANGEPTPVVPETPVGPVAPEQATEEDAPIPPEAFAAFAAEKLAGLAASVDDLVGQRRAWVRAKLEAIKATYPEALADLAASWPAGVPSFKGDHEHDMAELDAVVEVLRGVHARHGLDWLDDDPYDTACRSAEDPPSTAVDEGPDMEFVSLAALKVKWDSMFGPAAETAKRWAVEAHDGNVGFGLKPPHGIPSTRRFEIMRTVIGYATAYSGGQRPADEIVKAAFGFLGAPPPKPGPLSTPVGIYLGELTIDQARAMCDLLVRIENPIDTVHLMFDEGGNPRLVDNAAPAAPAA